jgi:hypothetical protein
VKLPSISGKERRTILIAAAVVVPALLYVWGVKPYVAALSDTRDQLSVERDALARERAAVAAAHRDPQLRRVADSAMAAVTPRLFTGRDDVMASAELAAYLGDVAHRSHLWLQDASTRPAVTTPGGLRTLKVEIRGESDLEGVLTFLQSIERGDRLVRVDRLDISRLPRASEQDEVETLSVSATISGFAIGDEGTAADSSAPAKPGAPKPAAPVAQATRGSGK